MKTRIGDISIQIRGVSYKPSDISDENDPQSIAILRANNISNHGEIETSDLVWITQNRVKPEQILRTGDILLCASSGSKGLVGKAAQVTGDYGMSFGAFCKVIRPMIANKKYLGFYFQSPQYRHLISEASAGININNIRAEDLDGLVIEIPSESEQDERCSVLDKVEKAILLRRQQIQKLNDLVKSQFIEMFGEEEKFEKVPLCNSVREMFIGPFGSSLKNDCFVSRDKGYCMIYEQKHAIRKSMNVETRYIDENKYRELSRFTIQGGDIIVSCRGTIGETFIVPNDAPLGIMHPSIMKIRIKESAYNRIFFNSLLQKVLKCHENEANGSGVKMAITATTLGKEEFILPPMALQKQFAHFVEQTDKSKVLFTQKLFFQLYMAICVKAFEKNVQMLYNCRREVAR